MNERLLDRPMSLRSAEYIQACQIARQTLKSEVLVIVGAGMEAVLRALQHCRGCIPVRIVQPQNCSFSMFAIHQTQKRSCQDQINPETNLP